MLHLQCKRAKSNLVGGVSFRKERDCWEVEATAVSLSNMKEVRSRKGRSLLGDVPEWSRYHLMAEVVRDLGLALQAIFVGGTGLSSGYGEACHVGLMTGFPSIAVLTEVPSDFKSSALVPLRQRGSARIWAGSKGEVLELCVRPGENVYIDLGYKVTFDEATSLTLKTSTGTSLPLPLSILRGRGYS